MKLTHCLAVTAVLSLCLAGCASTPPPAATTTTTTFAPAQIGTVAPAAAAPAAAAVTPAAAPAAGDPDAAAVIKMARNLGYRPQQRSGVTVYCRTEQQIGSHFEKTTCVSEATLPDLIRQQQQQQNAVSSAQRNCNGAICGGQ